MSSYIKLEDKDKKCLECPICKDFLVVPKVTRCNHVFCEVCLTGYIDHHAENCPPCPVCRQRIVIPQGGIKDFRTEHFYQTLSEKLGGREDNANCTKIEVCGFCKDFVEVEIKCLTCNCFICKPCLRAHKALKPHCAVIEGADIFNIDEDDLMSRRSVVCKIHPEELLKIYCLVCNESICVTCRLTSHYKHKCDNLVSYATHCRSEMAKLHADLDHMVDEATNAKGNIETMVKDFLDDVKVVEKTVNTTIDHLIAKLNSKRNKFLSKLNNKKSQVVTRFKRQTDKAECSELEGSFLREIVKKCQKYGTDVDVAFIKLDMEKQVENLRRLMYSILHKDFRMHVEYRGHSIQEIRESIDEYDVGEITFSQNLAIKTIADTTIKADSDTVVSGGMASHDDKLFITYQQRQSFMKWQVGEITYLDTPKEHVVTENSEYCLGAIGHMLSIAFCNADGDFFTKHLIRSVLNMRSGCPMESDSLPYVRAFTHCSCVDNGGLFMYDWWNKCIYRVSATGYIEGVIDNKYTKGTTLGLEVNKNGDILLLGQLKNGCGHCTLLSKDGTLKFRHLFDTSYGHVSSQTCFGSFDNMNNILTRVDSTTSSERSLWMLNPEKQNVERLRVPCLPYGPTLKPSGVLPKNDALLYLVANKFGKILTVSYLP